MLAKFRRHVSKFGTMNSGGVPTLSISLSESSIRELVFPNFLKAWTDEDL